jgi:hypothetical protein
MQSMHAEGTEILQLIPFVFLGTCVGRFKTNREEGNKRGRMGGGGGRTLGFAQFICWIYVFVAIDAFLFTHERGGDGTQTAMALYSVPFETGRRRQQQQQQPQQGVCATSPKDSAVL